MFGAKWREKAFGARRGWKWTIMSKLEIAGCSSSFAFVKCVVFDFLFDADP